MNNATDSTTREIEELWNSINALKSDLTGSLQEITIPHPHLQKDQYNGAQIKNIMEIEPSKGKVNRCFSPKNQVDELTRDYNWPTLRELQQEDINHEEIKSPDLNRNFSHRQIKTLLLPYQGRIIEVSPYHLKLFKGDLDEIEKAFGSRPIKEEEKNFRIRIPWKGCILNPTAEQLKTFEGNLDVIKNVVKRNQGPGTLRDRNWKCEMGGLPPFHF